MKEKTFPRVKNLFTRGDTQCLDSRLDTCEGCGEDYDRKSRGDNVLTGCCSEHCEHMLDEREHCAHCGEFCDEERHGMDGVYCSKWCLEAAEGVDDDA